MNRSRSFAKVLLLLGMVAAGAPLSCGRDVLVGASPMGGTYGGGGTTGTGGSFDPCAAFAGGSNGFSGAGGYGGTSLGGYGGSYGAGGSGFGGSGDVDGGYGGNWGLGGGPPPAGSLGAPNDGTGGSPLVQTGDSKGQGTSSVSCLTISAAPGTLNACGRTIGIAFSPDGTMLATATETAKPNIHLWRLSDGALLRDIEGPGDLAYAVAFSPDGTMLATAGTATTSTVCNNNTQASTLTDQTSEVKLWDVATGNILRGVPASTGNYAYTVRFSHDGNRLVTAGGSGAIEIWNASNRSAIGTDASLLGIINVTTTYYDVQFSPDDSRIVGAGMGVGGVWNTADASPVFSLPGFGEDMNDAAYSPDGTEIAATGANGLLRIFDASGNLLQSFVAHTVNYTSRVVWVDNDHVVSDDWGGNIKSWTRDSSNQFVGSGAWSLGSQAFGIAVSPDHKTLAVGGDGGFMFISYVPQEPAAVIGVK
jgi:WD40 repeat protein